MGFETKWISVFFLTMASSQRSSLFQRVKEELRRREGQPDVRSSGSSFLLDFGKSDTHQNFQEGLVEAAKLTNANCHDKEHSNNKP